MTLLSWAVKLKVFLFYITDPCGVRMLWKWKYCEFMCDKWSYLLKHYRLKHGNYGITVPFPCLHQECVCTFNSINAFKVHLAKIHQKTQGAQLSETAQVTFHCKSCAFSAPCTEAVFLTHLRSTHLKVNHRIQCPYNGCNCDLETFAQRASYHPRGQPHKLLQSRLCNWLLPASEECRRVSASSCSLLLYLLLNHFTSFHKFWI